MAPAGPLAGAERITILAGAAATMTAAQHALLSPLLRRALAGYRGVLLSGGTAVGLPGLVGEVARDLDLRAVGYVPAGRGDRSLYRELRETDGADGGFGVREPLLMWEDVVAARFAAADVRVVACPGGPITACELRLGRALGAHVASIDPAGDAPAPLADSPASAAGGLLELPPDAMTLRAFVNGSRPSEPLDRGLRAELVRRCSAPAFADAVPGMLALVGRRLARGGARLALRDDEVELLAEAEHGRRTVEALEGGPRRGCGEGAPPRPWAELSDVAREYDRGPVRTIDAALAAAGWGVTDA